MEIRQIDYLKIYGHLTGSLRFKQGENFLVGINGCGKTTVLNLIRWVLGPSIPELCLLKHDLIRIKLKHEGYIYSIESRITKESHILEIITADPRRDFVPITTALAPRSSGFREINEDIRAHYAHLSPEPHELQTWTFLIQELPSPVFIGLERSIEDVSSERRMQMFRKSQKTGERATPSSAAVTLMRDAFNTNRRRLVEINDNLNRKVLELSFSGVIKDTLKVSKSSSEATARKIENLRARFESTSSENNYSKALSSPDVRKAIIDYLDSLTGLLKTDGEDKKVWVMLNQHNFDRASKMFDLFEDYESQVGRVQADINRFTLTINSFLCDSGKRIRFNNDTGTPYFEWVKSGSILSLIDLSSGEAQIVVLLTYFAFLANKGIPIIIDEPELSLHVHWQKNFVKSVKSVMPDECQTIMATHSPEICGAEDVNVQLISIDK